MANEHELPSGPAEPVSRVKRLTLYLTASNSNPLSRLNFHIIGYTEADRNEDGGTLIPAGSSAEQLIDEFMSDDTPPFEAGIVPTPLDFALQEKCVVALKLFGDFWEFSRTRSPVTTKLNYGGRYHALLPHSSGDLRKGVSFRARQPLPPSGGQYPRHHFNLNVDFLDVGKRLPVLIDPDIENKGSN